MKCKFCLENQNLPFIFKDRNVESVSSSIDTDVNKLVIKASNQEVEETINSLKCKYITILDEDYPEFLKAIALVFPVSLLICFSNSCASIDQKDTSIAITDVKCIPNENSSTNVTFSLIVENHTIYDINNTTLYFKCLNASKVIDNHKKFVCNLEVPPNLIKISKYSFVFEDEINKIELESCEYD